MLTSLVDYHLICDRLCWSKARLFMSSGFHCVFRFFLWCYKQHSSCVICHTSCSHFGLVMGKILSLFCFLCLKQRGLKCAVVGHAHLCCICSWLLPHDFKRGKWRERETLSPWRSISGSIGKLLRLNPSDRPLGQWKTFNLAFIWVHYILYTHLNVFSQRNMKDTSHPPTLVSTKHSSSLLQASPENKSFQHLSCGSYYLTRTWNMFLKQMSESIR